MKKFESWCIVGTYPPDYEECVKLTIVDKYAVSPGHGDRKAYLMEVTPEERELLGKVRSQQYQMNDSINLAMNKMSGEAARALERITPPGFVRPTKPMSERDRWRYEFAGRAMQELLNAEHPREAKEEDVTLVICQTAVRVADALILELEKK